LPDLNHLYQYDEALHAFAKRHAEYVANDSVVAGEYSRDLARAYLDLLEKRGLPPKLKCYPSIQLATGEYFDFLNPDATPISPEAMAHSLSKVARCNGHTTGELSVSVAQHCVLSCRAAPSGFKFEALMHDAAECVTGDITTPAQAASQRLHPHREEHRILDPQPIPAAARHDQGRQGGRSAHGGNREARCDAPRTRKGTSGKPSRASCLMTC
jgi:hypothetical protein